MLSLVYVYFMLQLSDTSSDESETRDNDIRGSNRSPVSVDSPIPDPKLEEDSDPSMDISDPLKEAKVPEEVLVSYAQTSIPIPVVPIRGL